MKQGGAALARCCSAMRRVQALQERARRPFAVRRSAPLSTVMPCDAHCCVHAAATLQDALAGAAAATTVDAPSRASAAQSLAVLAELSGRFPDAIAFMTAAALEAEAAASRLSLDQLSTLARVCKAELTSLRGTLKMLALVAQAETVPLYSDTVRTYARDLEARMVTLAGTVQHVTEEHLVPMYEAALAAAEAAEAAASSGGAEGAAAASSLPPSLSRTAAVERLVFLHKLAADYCRYVSECCSDPGVVSLHSDRALSLYSKARSYWQLYLPRAAPAGLGVILNFTVFLYEVRKCEEEAREVALEAIEEASRALLEEGESSSGEARGILALLQDNVRLWQEASGRR